MGSGESTTRKVSFGVDDEDRVRILRGVKLSEDVLQRMRGVANIAPDRTNIHYMYGSRYEQQQKLLKEEWAKMAQREMEAAKEEMAKATSRERQQTRLEAERTKQLVQHLQKKDSQLKALDAFYKEQLAQLEKRKQRYKNDSFFTPSLLFLVFCRPRNTEAVCAGLQAQILSCYRDNKDQTLKCSDLAKEYMQCINAAKKVRAFSIYGYTLVINS
uniref:Coiled-coil-helix-coiled-coil-helix domain containing 6a n=1 Tax=Pundamilia nyererei TaxID=303518 RepID=A0A3B4F272_9CICH